MNFKKNKRLPEALDANQKHKKIGLLSYLKVLCLLCFDSNLLRSYKILLFVFALSLGLPTFAFVMESSGYRIQSDSVNVGGARSESSNYIQESTVGEIATGRSESSSYRLKAGYQQTQEAFLAISAIADITMSPDLGGITGGTANGGAQFTVETDNEAGFQVTIKTDSDNGMEGETQSGTIFHLETATPEVPDYTFTSAPANSSAFAYTINSSTTGEIVQAFRNNGSNTCNTGSTETDDNCWIAATTTARTIISTTSRTPTSGATSTIFFRVVVSENHSPILPADIYTATTTLTATAL